MRERESELSESPLNAQDREAAYALSLIYCCSLIKLLYIYRESL